MPQIRTTFEPDRVITVDDLEYESLLRQGLIWDGSTFEPEPTVNVYMTVDPFTLVTVTLTEYRDLERQGLVYAIEDGAPVDRPDFTPAQYAEFENPNSRIGQGIAAIFDAPGPIRESVRSTAIEAAGEAVVGKLDKTEAAGTYATKEELPSLDGLVRADAIEVALPERLGAGELSATYTTASELVVNVMRHGAVADYTAALGAASTDNYAAFRAAYDATPVGGTLFVPPGRYYLSQTFVLDRAINFDCGAGGSENTRAGTELIFAAGATGIWVKQDSFGIVPSGWRVGPFELKSLSTVATDHTVGYGVYCTNGVGFMDRTTAKGFGSHGFFLKAGAADGGGNVNNTTLNRVRSYQNFGDGIRMQGSDAQQTKVITPDVVANYGWGINNERASANRVLFPHIDQGYNSSPGAIRDTGNSNTYEDVYCESGGNGAVVLFELTSQFARLTSSQYGRPVVTDTTTAKSAQIIDREYGFTRQVRVRGLSATQLTFDVDVSSTGTCRLLVSNTASLPATALDINTGAGLLRTYLPLTPNATGTLDLGTNALRFRNASFSSFVRVGAVATASRPTAATAGAGAHMFDTTLGKPIWSDGTNWKDATGAVV